MSAGLLKLILKGVVAGIINVLFFALIMNGVTNGGKTDEVAVNTYVLNFFVGWVFFSAWFLAKSDDEWKKVAEAVAKRSVNDFLIEAPKRIAPSIRVLYLIISVLVLLSFHLFHITSSLVLVEIQFGVGFLIVTTILVLWDLDDPIGGVINVPGIPEDWLKKLPR